MNADDELKLSLSAVVIATVARNVKSGDRCDRVGCGPGFAVVLVRHVDKAVHTSFFDTRRDRSGDGEFKGASTNFENYRK